MCRLCVYSTAMAYRIYLAFAPLVAMLLLVVMILLLRYRVEAPARALLRYAALSLGLIVVNAAELLAGTPALTLLFAKLQYISFMLLPLTFAGFCLRYTGHDKFFPVALRVVLAVLAGLCFGMVLTNEWHGLFWREVAFIADRGLSVMRPKYGVFFFLAAGFAWLVMAAATVFVLRAYDPRRGNHRLRSIWILIGVLLPGGFNFINILRIFPGLEKDFTPLGFGLSALAFFVGGFMTRSIHLVPLARGVVLEELDEGYVLLDQYGRLADFNLAASRLVNLPSKAVGQHYASIAGLRILDEHFMREGDRVVVEGAQNQGETITWRAESGDRQLQVKLRAIQGSSGPRGTAILIGDITAQAHMEIELERTRANVLKSERFAVIGRLAADIAHEINNPLGYVWSNFRSLRASLDRAALTSSATPAGPLGAGAADMLHSIDGGLERIERVVRGLLEYSRRGATQGNQLIQYDLNRGLRTALELSRPDYESFVGIELDLAPLPFIAARGNELDQVLLNILRNAADAVNARYAITSGLLLATGDKPGQIVIRTRHESGVISCEIGNNGWPIAPEQAEKIFEAFYSTKSSQQGTGLGLSISREIIEKRHGGRLRLVSIDPVCFRIELPAGSPP